MRVRRIARIAVCFGALAAACAPPPPRDPMPDPVAERLSVEQWTIMAAAANALLPGLGDTAAAVCVSLFHGPAGFDVPPARLAMLNHPGVVAATACPQTYASMSQQVDSLGRPLDTRPRPPGHVDPYRLQIFDPHPDGPGHAWVEMRLGRGLAGTEYLCSVFSTGREQRAFCRPGASWVH